jgi:chromosome segregation ATPase
MTNAEYEAEILVRNMELEAMAQEVARARASERAALAEVKLAEVRVEELRANVVSLGKSHAGLAQKLGAQEDAIRRARKVCEVSQPRGGSIGALVTSLRRYADALEVDLATLNAPWEEPAEKEGA